MNGPLKAPSQEEIDAFVQAAQAFEAGQITAFLDRYPSFIDRKASSGRTALTKAAAHGQNDLVKLLLEKGAHIDAADQYGETALMRAALKGHTDAVRQLLEGGADTGIENNRGQTALMMARIWGDALEIAALIEQWPELQRSRREEDLRKAAENADRRAQERAAARRQKLKNGRPPKPPFRKGPA